MRRLPGALYAVLDNPWEIVSANRIGYELDGDLDAARDFGC